MIVADDILQSVIVRGDLAHMALFLWAAAASLLAMRLIRELSLSNRRFSDFVSQVARLNRVLNHYLSDSEQNFNGGSQAIQKTHQSAAADRERKAPSRRP
ncbi:MAG: hypothetical protein HWE23_04400 [Rhodobacteraceae bacterium]|nr:hypothetical protein [Paracoccaceae bacterium]